MFSKIEIQVLIHFFNFLNHLNGQTAESEFYIRIEDFLNPESDKSEIELLEYKKAIYPEFTGEFKLLIDESINSVSHIQYKINSEGEIIELKIADSDEETEEIVIHKII